MSDEHKPGEDKEQRNQYSAGPCHIAKEAGHLDSRAFRNRAHHEIGSVANVGVSAHEHCASRNGNERGCHVRHKVLGIPASRIEEHQIGGRVVKEA